MSAKPEISLIPGPVSVLPEALAAMNHDYDAGRQEYDHLPLYLETAARLKRVAGTERCDAVIMSGEGMLALWAGLKSCLSPGDKVLAVGTGVFGDGIGEMAASFGCRAEVLSLPPDSTLNCGNALERVEEAVKRFRPKMITAVHCETPSGTLNPLKELGGIKKRLGVPLFYVDAVSSLGGAEVLADEWNIDLLLGGTQKCFSCPPNLAFLLVSPEAWDEAAKTAYQGYDALLPFRAFAGEMPFPYTPYRQGTAALNESAGLILAEGLENCFKRHAETAAFCRESLLRLGLELFPQDGAIHSPTVSAVKVPRGTSWTEWRDLLKKNGLTVGGSLGPMEGKVFRLGHMGRQADMKLISGAVEIIAASLKEI